MDMEKNPINPKIGGGLLPHKPDRRDYSHHKTFGAIPLSSLPDEYLLTTEILNQGGTSHCTAYSACAVAESQFGKKFDPEQFYTDEGIENSSNSSDGYDLRTTMATGVDIGFKPLDGQEKIKEGGYFLIDGPYDLFDNIRVAMFLAKDEKKCAEIGTMWYSDWTSVFKGIISDGQRIPSGLHAIKCAGWTRNKRDGTPLPSLPNNDYYLAMQNSYGEGLGDDGLWYFPRSIVNKEFTEGYYMWRVKPDAEKIKTIGIVASIMSRIVIIMTKIALRLGFTK